MTKFCFVVFFTAFCLSSVVVAQPRSGGDASSFRPGPEFVGSVAVNRVSACMEACRNAQQQDWLTGICRGSVQSCMRLEECQGLADYLTHAAIARAFAEACQVPIVISPIVTSPALVSSPTAATSTRSRRPRSSFTHHSDCQASCRGLQEPALAACTTACRDRDCVRWQSVEHIQSTDGNPVLGMCVGDRAGLIRAVDSIAGTARHANETAERAMQTTTSFETRLAGIEGRVQDAERVARLARCEVNREVEFTRGRAENEAYNASVARHQGEVNRYCSGPQRSQRRCREALTALHVVSERRILALRSLENQPPQVLAALRCEELEQPSTPATPSPEIPGTETPTTPTTTSTVGSIATTASTVVGY